MELNHPIIRELWDYPKDVVLEHGIEDQFSDMVCFGDYILALQIKAAQLVVFDGKTKQLLTRIAIPMGRLALRGICVDEVNCMVFVCTTTKLFCISTHDIAILKDPVVTEISVRNVRLDAGDVFSGTMGINAKSRHIYMVVAKGHVTGVNVQYAVAKIDQLDHTCVSWVDLKGYDFFQLCSMIQIGDVMVAFSNNGAVLFIDGTDSVCGTQEIDHAYSLYKAMYDTTCGTLYATNLKMDHMWSYGFFGNHFAHKETSTSLTPSLFPTPICISASRCRFDIFDNNTGRFREWTFTRTVEEGFKNSPMMDDSPLFDFPPLPAVLSEEEDYKVVSFTYDDVVEFCDSVYDIDLSNGECAFVCPSDPPLDMISSDFFEHGRSSDSEEHISTMVPIKPEESPYLTLALSGKILPDFSFKTSDQEEEYSIRRSGKRVKREFANDDDVVPLKFRPFGSFISLDDDDYTTTPLVSVDFPCN